MYAPTLGLSQLTTPFFSYRAKPFTRWHIFSHQSWVGLMRSSLLHGSLHMILRRSPGRGVHALTIAPARFILWMFI